MAERADAIREGLGAVGAEISGEEGEPGGEELGGGSELGGLELEE